MATFDSDGPAWTATERTRRTVALNPPEALQDLQSVDEGKVVVDERHVERAVGGNLKCIGAVACRDDLLSGFYRDRTGGMATTGLLAPLRCLCPWPGLLTGASLCY